MKWTQTAFRSLWNRLIAWRKSITPWAFACVLFSACSLPFSSARGDDFEEFEETNSVLRIEDLTPETRVAVSNLAIALSANSLGDRAAATLEDNVASILALLNSAAISASGVKLWRVVPYSSGGASSQPIGNAIFRGLFGMNATSTSLPVVTDGYLYQLQRAVYGQSGVPSSSQAILPVLWRMESALTNNQSSVDMGWTNRLDALSLILSQLDGTARYGFSLSQWIDENRNVAGNLYSLQSYLASVVHSHSEGPYNSTLLEVFDSALADVWESQAYNASSTDSALRVVDANVLSALMQLDSTLSGIGSDLSDLSSLVGSGFGSTSSVSNQLADLLASVSAIEDYTRDIHYDDLEYYNTDRSVQRDFHFLHQQLGVEQPSRTNNIYYLFSRLFDDSSSRSVVAATGAVIASEINAAKQSAESSVASSSNMVVRIADDEEPDWDEHRYTGSNPFDAGDNIFDLPVRQANAAFLPLAESQHKEIVLFRGNFPIFGGRTTRSQSNVPLNIAYPLIDYDAVSGGLVTMRSIMEWVWAWVALCINVLMLFRFYQSLARTAIGAEQGFFNE